MPYVTFASWNYVDESVHAGSSFHYSLQDLREFENRHSYEIQLRDTVLPFPLDSDLFKILDLVCGGTIFNANIREAQSLKAFLKDKRL